MNSPNLEPGKKLNSREQEALRKDNEKATREAHQMARESVEQDIRSGRKPVISEVAESLKKRLEDKFGKKGEK